MENMHWLILSYKMPSEPSSKRVSIWRRIKNLGAVYIQSGVCLLPSNEDHQRQFKIIQNDITNYGGEAFLLNCSGFDKKEEENIIARFNRERNEEYQELLNKSQSYIKGIQREMENKHFTYGELQENDEDLKKLRNWWQKLKTVDFYGAELATEAEKQLSVCERSLEEFSHAVFSAEGQG